MKLEAVRPLRGSDRLALFRGGFFKRRSRAERDQGSEIKILVPYEDSDSSRFNCADDARFCDISIKPFRDEQDGFMFGLVLDEPEGDEDVTSATLWPNDIMFHAPWDGEYST